MAIHDYTVQEMMSMQQGRAGSQYVADTVAHPGKWVELVALTACVIAAITGNAVGFAGATIPAGMSLAGEFTTFTLTSGTLIAYKGV